MSTTPTDPTAMSTSPEHGDTPATETSGTVPTRRRHRRPAPRAARVEPAAEVAAAEPAPVIEAAPPAPSAPPTPRRNTRRTGRSFAPKLVTPALTTPAEDTVATADADASSAAPGSQVAAGDEAVSSEVAPAVDTAQPVIEETPPKRHRFRFERPAAAAPQFAPRPERLSGPVAAPTPAPNGTTALAPANGGAPAGSDHGPAGMPNGMSDVTTTESATAEQSAPQDERETPVAREVASPADQTATPSPAVEPSDTAQADAADESEESTAARRRRRRRRSGGAAIRHLEAIAPVSDESEPYAAEDELESYPSGTDVTVIPTYGEPAHPAAIHGSAQQDAWSVGSAYQQLGQPRSPFGAPEPNTPRGFGAQPQGVAAPFQERPTRTPRTDRSGGELSSTALSQLGSTLTQAIQQQTDRLLVTLRHTQAPPTMTLALPALPSTERIGVFVDVANLLYSSRSLRVGVDFGRLLEFLRANRHVVRAHAYAPTNPEPNAEQQFLSVVKGVGYRITTKNFKVFSSGAKKADLDLDLCMDIVRLVDAKAVDTIVLVSGDSDFLPLLEYCSDHGVRVEVAAFEDAAAMILRQSCDLFINLSLVDEIRP